MCGHVLSIFTNFTNPRYRRHCNGSGAGRGVFTARGHVAPVARDVHCVRCHVSRVEEPHTQTDLSLTITEKAPH